MPVPPALTPALALDYVRELSADVRAALVLDAAGEIVAGATALAEPARALLAAAGDAAELEAGTADGLVCAVRSPDHAMIAVCGRFAIASVVRQDLRVALAALEGRSPDAAERPGRAADPAAAPVAERREAASEPAAGSPADSALIEAAERLISAAQRDFRQ